MFHTVKILCCVFMFMFIVKLICILRAPVSAVLYCLCVLSTYSLCCYVTFCFFCVANIFDLI